MSIIKYFIIGLIIKIMAIYYVAHVCYLYIEKQNSKISILDLSVRLILYI